jgi:hypothetical protein
MGRPLPTNATAFAEGQSTVENVLDELGTPNQVGRLPGGFAFLYEHSVVNSNWALG